MGEVTFFVLEVADLRVRHTQTQTTPTDVTSPPRADPNFLTHFTAKGGSSIFEWSTLSM